MLCWCRKGMVPLLIRICNGIAALFAEKGCIFHEQEKWFSYCLQRRAIKLAAWALLFFIGMPQAGAAHTLLFIAVFMWMRRYMGGFHASSPFRCLAISGFCEWLCLCFAIPFTVCHSWLSPALSSGCCVAVFLLSPAIHPFSGLGPKAAKWNHTRAKGLAVVLLCGTLLFCFLSFGYTAAIVAWGEALAMLTVAAAKINGQEVKSHDSELESQRQKPDSSQNAAHD